MGAVALSLILEDLRENSGHWYWALKAISNEDPVPPEDRGAIKSMKAAWLRWGEAKGFIKPDLSGLVTRDTSDFSLPLQPKLSSLQPRG